MKLARGITVTFPQVLFLCFFCGIGAGAAAANGLGAELMSRIGYFESAYRPACGLDRTERFRLLGYVCRRRSLDLGLAALVGMTPFSAAGFAAFAFAGGFGCGLLISVMTLQKGLLGLPLFLLTLFPQWLCYLPVWADLAVTAEDGLTDVKPRKWLFLAILALLGMLLETYVNSRLLLL